MYQIKYYEREKSKRICTEFYETMPSDDDVYELMDSIDSRFAEVYYDKYGTRTYDLFKGEFTI